MHLKPYFADINTLGVISAHFYDYSIFLTRLMPGGSGDLRLRQVVAGVV